MSTRTSQDIISAAYRGLLKREPDETGLGIYTYLLDSGEPLDQILGRFVASEEFQVLQRTDLPVTLETAGDWIGFGREEVDYIKSWQDHSLEGRPGFLTDFVGVRTRIANLWRECAAYDGQVYPLPIPMDYHADILEYVGTLRAVDAAKGSLSVMELGAGMGPWTVTAAVAARRRRIKKIFLCAIEGDAGRHATMLQHLEDNGLQEVPQEIIQAAVAVEDGEALWPALDDPKNQAGARPLREGEQQDASYLSGAFDLGRMVRVPLIAFRRLLAKRPLWDLIHIDVQGTEVELCAAEIERLNACARYLVIGTHSRKIDGELIELFHSAGWVLENAKPATVAYSKDAVSVLHMTSIDGTQIWRNPRL